MVQKNLSKITFVLGGAASGKSIFAETLCVNSGLTRLYLATSLIWDDEMRAKMEAHKIQRGVDWQTIEEPRDIAKALLAAPASSVVLVDCLTMWLNNIMMDDDSPDSWRAPWAQVETALADCAAHIVFVSNEVGQGIVPENALSRRFRNAQGKLNQAVAARADTVVNVIAGLPQILKGAL